MVWELFIDVGSISQIYTWKFQVTTCNSKLATDFIIHYSWLVYKMFMISFWILDTSFRLFFILLTEFSSVTWLQGLDTSWNWWLFGWSGVACPVSRKHFEEKENKNKIYDSGLLCCMDFCLWYPPCCSAGKGNLM